MVIAKPAVTKLSANTDLSDLTGNMMSSPKVACPFIGADKATRGPR